MTSSGPILSLPIEVLHRIFGFIPDPKEGEVWFSQSEDTPMLLPISQTCRLFRDITNSSPTLWRSVSIGGKPNTLCTAQIAASRSDPRPLSVDLRLSPDVSDKWTDVHSLWSNIAPRVREVHVLIASEHTNQALLFELPTPQLDSFSYANYMERHFSGIGSGLFTKGLNPQLRRLSLGSVRFLPECELPKLTHLALGDVEVSHANVIGLLGRCPNLESLILRNIRQRAEPNLPHLYPDLPLPRLRRVVLKDLRYNFLPFYLQKIPKHSHGYSLQIIGVQRDPRFCDAGALLHGHSISSPQTIRIGLEPLPAHPLFFTLSVMFVSSLSLVRVGTTIRPSDHPAMEGPDWLGRTLQDKAALRSVTELRLVNLPRDGSRSNWQDNFDEPLRSVLADLPSLEIVSIVFDHSHSFVVPDLRVLPDGREPGFNSPRLKTLRLVYSYDRDSEYRRIVDTGMYGDLLKPRKSQELNLTRLLDQLQTGAFEYLDRLVIRVPSHFTFSTFSEAGFRELRGFVHQMEIEYSDERFDIPLPEFAREPEASGCPSHWTGISH